MILLSLLTVLVPWHIRRSAFKQGTAPLEEKQQIFLPDRTIFARTTPRNAYRVSAFRNQSRGEWGETTGTHLGYLECIRLRALLWFILGLCQKRKAGEQIASTDGRAVTSFLLFLLAITPLCFQSVNQLKGSKLLGKIPDQRSSFLGGLLAVLCLPTSLVFTS